MLPDAALRTIIRRELRIKHGITAGGEIMRHQLARLRRLDLLPYPQIRSLEGLEAAAELRYLRLPFGGRLVSLQPLAALAKRRGIQASLLSLLNCGRWT